MFKIINRTTNVTSFLIQLNAGSLSLQAKASVDLNVSSKHGYHEQRTNILASPKVTHKKQVLTMRKLIAGSGNTTRKKWHVGEGEGTKKIFSDLSFLMNNGGKKPNPSSVKHKSGKALKRVGVLSTVFMEQITSLLASGEVENDILGRGLEISQVKISSDFTCVNVYWYSKGIEKDEVIESQLKSLSGQLRHTLSQLRVMGQVPPIVFVKDTSLSRLLQVEEILSKIDFGDDFEPTKLGHNFRSTVKHEEITCTPSKGNNQNSVECNNRLKNDEDEGSEVPGSTAQMQQSQINMRQDVLGLDWNRIMTKISNGVQHEQNRKRIPPELKSITVEKGSQPEEIIGEISSGSNREREFLQFLKQRRILKSKELKRQKLEDKDRELAVERMRLALEPQLAKFDEPSEKDDDYLEEEEYSGFKN